MARTVEASPRNDAYTGLLAISFLALVAACLLMALDANELGDPPPKLNIDVPGVTPGKAGEGLRRPDAGKVEGGAPDGKGNPMGRAEPGRGPELAAVTVPAVVVPARADVPVDADTPPLPVQPFDPSK